MAVKKRPPRFHVGDHVAGKYRSATWTGRVTGVAARGSTEATTKYSIRPDKASRHKGEPARIHRYGDKIHKAR